MEKDWTEAKLAALIHDEVEESLELDYKAAAALDRTDAKKREVTKDVSAMANATGGVIIYGMAEYADPLKRHLPEKLDPVLRGDISKEWLEHVISGIRPRIDGLVISPVPLTSRTDHVAYVVQIPQGRTAHQATDLKYYKRHNFEAVPMNDYEIRDIMARAKNPRIEISPWLQVGSDGGLILVLFYHNTGDVYAEYVNGFVLVPVAILPEEPQGGLKPSRSNGYREFRFENIHKDLVSYIPGTPSLSGGGTPSRPFYISRYDPVLPGLGRDFRIELGITKVNLPQYIQHEITWTVFADNSPTRTGGVTLGQISVSDEDED